mmetsp:Transcript_66111/g.149238  ORF Transcript_66111/g.149238 Transcript_66111/m.149238 type:complete len:315 (-) Transcript_66111:23-967(-)
MGRRQVVGRRGGHAKVCQGVVQLEPHRDEDEHVPPAGPDIDGDESGGAVGQSNGHLSGLVPRGEVRPHAAIRAKYDKGGPGGVEAPKGGEAAEHLLAVQVPVARGPLQVGRDLEHLRDARHDGEPDALIGDVAAVFAAHEGHAGDLDALVLVRDPRNRLAAHARELVPVEARHDLAVLGAEDHPGQPHEVLEAPTVDIGVAPADIDGGVILSRVGAHGGNGEKPSEKGEEEGQEHDRLPVALAHGEADPTEVAHHGVVLEKGSAASLSEAGLWDRLLVTEADQACLLRILSLGNITSANGNLCHPRRPAHVGYV